jgi:uncharacterized protein YukE
MSIASLIRMAFQVVSNVLSQLTQMNNLVEQGAMAPVKAIIGQVTGGSWKGDGADKFVQELSTMMVPGIGRVGSQITRLSGNLNRAVNVMNQADQQVNSLAKGLGDLFGGIFS